MVLFNWKQVYPVRYPARSLLFLLLCGDVHPNPRPVSSYPCGVCKLDVSDSDAAVCCDVCDQWVHVSCDNFLTMDTYNDMVLHPSDDIWTCSVCQLSGSPSTHSGPDDLLCLCFNARSIVQKRFDLQAIIISISPDIIAITETFLYDCILDSELFPQGYCVFRHDQSRHGSGVLNAMRISIYSFCHKDLEHQDIDSLVATYYYIRTFLIGCFIGLLMPQVAINIPGANYFY